MLWNKETSTEHPVTTLVLCLEALSRQIQKLESKQSMMACWLKEIDPKLIGEPLEKSTRKEGAAQRRGFRNLYNTLLNINLYIHRVQLPSPQKQC